MMELRAMYVGEKNINCPQKQSHVHENATTYIPIC